MPTQYYHIENYTCGNMKFISNVHHAAYPCQHEKEKFHFSKHPWTIMFITQKYCPINQPSKLPQKKH
jgi:hypothetical protein